LDVTRDPRYWERNEYVIVETSLYDNESDRLIWTAKTETMEPDDYLRLGGSIANVIADRLAYLGLIDTQSSGGSA